MITLLERFLVHLAFPLCTMNPRTTASIISHPLARISAAACKAMQYAAEQRLLARIMMVQAALVSTFLTALDSGLSEGGLIVYGLGCSPNRYVDSTRCAS